MSGRDGRTNIDGVPVLTSAELTTTTHLFAGRIVCYYCSGSTTVHTSCVSSEEEKWNRIDEDDGEEDTFDYSVA